MKYRREIINRGKIILLSSVFCLLLISSKANFDFNENCQMAMRGALDLRLKDARLLIAAEKELHPDNGYTIYLEHYCESIELIATEDIAVYERLIDSYSDRMNALEKLDDGTPVSRWLQAEMLFQTGLAQLKFGTRINGATKILSSYERIREHRRKYPQFYQNQKLTGVFNIILDNVPSFLQWAADLFGYSGDSTLGLFQLQDYADKSKNIPGFAEDAMIMVNLGFLLARQEEDAFEWLSNQEQEMMNLTLARYLYANAASFVYRNDLAIKTLSEIDKTKLQVNFYAFPYSLGRAKLNHLEKDANVYLEDFLNNYPVLDYKKATCNRLAFYYLIEGNTDKYEEYKQMVLTVGQDLRDRDQEAIYESTDPLIPHVSLLKARLLCDGGYFGEALEMLETINLSSLENKAYLLEYYYRKGRIFQLQGQSDQAITELSRAYQEGKSDPFTFATRAALYLGKIYEEKKDYSTAYQWYQKCLEIYSSANSTEGVKSDAEKGMKRIKGRF